MSPGALRQTPSSSCSQARRGGQPHRTQSRSSADRHRTARPMRTHRGSRHERFKLPNVRGVMPSREHAALMSRSKGSSARTAASRTSLAAPQGSVSARGRKPLTRSARVSAPSRNARSAWARPGLHETVRSSIAEALPGLATRATRVDPAPEVLQAPEQASADPDRGRDARGHVQHPERSWGDRKERRRLLHAHEKRV